MEREIKFASRELRGGAIWEWDLTKGEFTVSSSMRRLLNSGDRSLESLADLVSGVALDRDNESDQARRDLIQALIDDPLAAVCSQEEFEVTFLSEDRLRWLSLRAQCIIQEGHITTVFGRVDDVTKHRKEIDEAREEASTDHLTGLFNKRKFEQAVAEALVFYSTSPVLWLGDKIVYISIDLDRLKYINDTFSHPGGDEVLRSLGLRLQSLVTEDGRVVAGRLGGDEFAILGRCSSEEEYESLVKTTHALLSYAHEFSPQIVSDTRSIQVTVSMGVAFTEVAKNPQIKANQLRANSDLALYASKRGHGHQYQVYSQELREKINQADASQLELASMLNTDSLPLAWMPIADISSGQIIGVELLLDDAIKARIGVDSNEDVIRRLEELGLLEQHDTLSLFYAMMEHQVTNQNHVDQPIFLSVNLTPQNLVGNGGSHHGDIVVLIEQLLRWCKLPAHLLHIEISEDQTLDQTNVEIHRCLAGLRRLGVVLVCDDFGKGYANFDRLINFPYFTKVKLDKLLVNQLNAQSSMSSELVASLVRLLVNFRLDVCAEGVESVDQLPLLRNSGCTSVQGYLIGQKLSTQDLSAFLETYRDGHWIGSYDI